MGIIASRGQRGIPEYVDLLGVHAARDRRGRKAIQLRTVHAWRGRPPVQDAVGRARRAAVVVRLGGVERSYDAISQGWPVPVGTADLAATAGFDRHQDG